jgi:hypothetical protein
MRLSPADAHALASQLDLDYRSVPICLACLTFVSFPLDQGRDRKARREALAFAPHFWEEGLAAPTRIALEEACDRGIDRAAEATRELELLGPRSEIVTAIVLRLAAAQVDEMRALSRRLEGGT